MIKIISFEVLNGNYSGSIEFQQENGEDGAVITTNWHEGGWKTSIDILRINEGIRYKSWYNSKGEVIAKCSFLNGMPWNGTYNSGDKIITYEDGKIINTIIYNLN